MTAVEVRCPPWRFDVRRGEYMFGPKVICPPWRFYDRRGGSMSAVEVQ